MEKEKISAPFNMLSFSNFETVLLDCLTCFLFWLYGCLLLLFYIVSISNSWTVFLLCCTYLNFLSLFMYSASVSHVFYFLPLNLSSVRFSCSHFLNSKLSYSLFFLFSVFKTIFRVCYNECFKPNFLFRLQ